MFAELERMGIDARFISQEDLFQPANQRIEQLTAPFRLAAAVERRAADVDVVDIAGGDGWAYARLAHLRRRRQAIVARSNGLWFRALAVEPPNLASSPLRRAMSDMYQRAVPCRWERRSIETADLALFLSQPDADDVVSRGWKAADEVAVINPGVDDYFDSAVPLPARKDIVFVGTFSYRKGSDVVAAALSGVLIKHPETHFSVFGAGVPAEAVLSQFPPSVRDRVHVSGAVASEMLAQRLQHFAVMVFPTRYEGFGIVVLEAMRAGIAVVTTRTGAGVDLVRDGHNGVIVPIGDVEATAAATARLLDDSALRIALASNAAADTRGRTWRSAATSLVQSYERALALSRR